MIRKVDKSLFTEEERTQYEALIAKASVEVDDDAAGADTPATADGKEEGNTVDTAKSASPEITAAMARLENLEKSIAMKEFTEIAKKYAPLGEKEEDLANTLYNMKKSNPENYDAYIAVLDKSLGLVEKSGVFAEVGKSASGAATGDAEAKINSIANEIMKADTNMSREQAVAKAWIDHPELVAEYESNYKA
jgi:hypothetical protein